MLVLCLMIISLAAYMDARISISIVMTLVPNSTTNFIGLDLFEKC